MRLGVMWGGSSEVLWAKRLRICLQCPNYDIDRVPWCPLLHLAFEVSNCIFSREKIGCPDDPPRWGPETAPTEDHDL